MGIKTAVVSGAAGFTGIALVTKLLEKNVAVYALVRPGSSHNGRLPKEHPFLHIIETEPERYADLVLHLKDCPAVFFHLIWGGEKGIWNQKWNLDVSLQALELAHRLGCERFISTGSQAEYGVVPLDTIAREDMVPHPVNSYGATKVAACYLTEEFARELGLEWIWCRIFSLIGQYEPEKRMLPSLYHSLQEGVEYHMSSGQQNWDYLDVYDAAEALIALAEKGRAGEIYNIANGSYRPLIEYTEEIRRELFPNEKIVYGSDPTPFISLQPSVEKIKDHTGWIPRIPFLVSVKHYENML